MPIEDDVFCFRAEISVVFDGQGGNAGMVVEELWRYIKDIIYMV